MKSKPNNLFNRSQKQTFYNYGLFSETDENGYLLLKAAKIKGGEQPVLQHTQYRRSERNSGEMGNEIQTVPKAVGLYDIAHA